MYGVRDCKLNPLLVSRLVHTLRLFAVQFSLPDRLSDWMGVFQIFSFDIGLWLFDSWTCVGDLRVRVAFNGLWPVGLVAALALLLAARNAALRASFGQTMLQVLEAAIFVSFCVLPSVTRS